MTRIYSPEEIESVFRFFRDLTGLGKEELFELMNELTPWVTDQELENLWRQDPQKAVLQ